MRSRLPLTVARPRLLRAAKTALAVGIAWSLAPYMPGTADEYPYYAPLGALLSMHPTLASSIRNGLQTLAGLAIGIGLATIVMLLGDPNVLTISLAIGVSVLIASARWLGSGGEYAAVAALFVLIVGRTDAGDYSFGYLLQMSMGIAVGLAVNFLILPPLAFQAAGQQMSLFRTTLAKQLDDIGEALIESWPPEHEEWATRNQTLADTADEVREAVRHADDTRKGNPRARIHRRDLDTDFDDLSALESVTFHLRDATEVLAGAVWGRTVPVELVAGLRPQLSGAMHAVAHVLTEWDSSGDTQKALRRAEEALRSLEERLLERRDAEATSLGPASAILLDLQRMLALLRSRIGVEAGAAA
ncbi:MAG: hypothetical protein JWL94_1751 [Microbacteriaceae bacterium]|jgi:hypothetical protein|nr:hypothetical protein [Microbacteriaceae bacterium]HEV7957545.1 aromatic acid exporter family protein [Marisediminicola sp.]